MAKAREHFFPDQHATLPVVDGLEGIETGLTPRETMVVELARDRLSNAEIAERLVISIRTVENHLYHSMHKLGVNDRRDL